jgi:hypothetical protein
MMHLNGQVSQRSEYCLRDAQLDVMLARGNVEMKVEWIGSVRV